MKEKYSIPNCMRNINAMFNRVPTMIECFNYSLDTSTDTVFVVLRVTIDHVYFNAAMTNIKMHDELEDTMQCVMDICKLGLAFDPTSNKYSIEYVVSTPDVLVDQEAILIVYMQKTKDQIILEKNYGDGRKATEKHRF